MMPAMRQWPARARVVAVLAACASCSSSGSQDPVELTELPTFTVRVAQRSLEQVMIRGEALVDVLAGGAAAKMELRAGLLEASRSGGDRWTAQLQGGLMFWYDRRRDELHLELDSLAVRPADK